MAEEVLVVTEEDPKSLGESEEELSVGQGKQELLVEVLGEQEGSLLAAGRAQMEPPTRRRSEVLVPTFRVRTAGASNALAVVAAGEEAARHASDAFDAEVPEFPGVAGIVFRGKTAEVISEEALEGTGFPLGAGQSS